MHMAVDTEDGHDTEIRNKSSDDHVLHMSLSGVIPSIPI